MKESWWRWTVLPKCLRRRFSNSSSDVDRVLAKQEIPPRVVLPAKGDSQQQQGQGRGLEPDGGYNEYMDEVLGYKEKALEYEHGKQDDASGVMTRARLSAEYYDSSAQKNDEQRIKVRGKTRHIHFKSRCRPAYLPSLDRHQQDFSPLEEVDVIKVMQSWINTVVGGTTRTRLCPFALSSSSTRSLTDIVVCPERQESDQLRAIFYQAAKLVQVPKDDTDCFRSTLIVFPNRTSQIEPLYAKLLLQQQQEQGTHDDTGCQFTIGSIAQWMGDTDIGVQAIPFESCAVSHLKQRRHYHHGDDEDDEVDVPLLTAVAPFATIQLIRYSDFAKIPDPVRRRILARNRESAATEYSYDPLEMVEDCFYVIEPKTTLK